MMELRILLGMLAALVCLSECFPDLGLPQAKRAIEVGGRAYAAINGVVPSVVEAADGLIAIEPFRKVSAVVPTELRKC